MFAELVRHYFGFLVTDYGFAEARCSDTELTYEAHGCRVSIFYDPRDQGVDVRVSSLETTPTSRLRANLRDIVAVLDPDALSKEAEGSRYECLDRGWMLRRELEVSARLLHTYGGPFLQGDFALRPAIVRRQAGSWLEMWRTNISSKPYVSHREDGLQQMKFEYKQFNKEHQEAVWRILDEWTQGCDSEKRKLAVALIECL